MKKLLLASVFITLATIVPLPTMAEADINAGISLPPPTVFEAPQGVIVVPCANGVYVVADADADTQEGAQSGSDEKQQDQSLEKEKTADSEHKSNWKINVWPIKPPDNIMTPHERKEENKHLPPDR